MNEANLRRNLKELLGGGSAHLTLDQALEGLPPALRGRRPSGRLKSVWELLEHMRIGQHDILCYIQDPGWQSPPWPEGYWPDLPEELSDEAWQRTLEGLRADAEVLIALAGDEGRDLTAEIPHGEGRTYLRELFLVADHNSYHLGQIVDARRQLGAWQE